MPNQKEDGEGGPPPAAASGGWDARPHDDSYQAPQPLLHFVYGAKWFALAICLSGPSSSWRRDGIDSLAASLRLPNIHS
jgi:hypothetical protein